MATANFLNHYNGIFIVDTPEDAMEDMFYLEDFFEYVLRSELERRGMELIFTGDFEGIVYSRNDKMLAKVYLQSGYYGGTQLIVETDPDEFVDFMDDIYFNDRIQDYQDEPVKSKLYEVYSEHNKTLFKAIKEITTPLKMVGQFSNGEAVYEIA